MDEPARSVFIVALAFALLVAQSVFSPMLAPNLWSPNLLIPIIVAVALSASFTPVHGATLAFVIGYLHDSFTGNPLGLQTFVMVACFLLAFMIGKRFSFRGMIFQMVLTFVLAALSAILVYALRAMFDPAGLTVDVGHWVLTIAACSAASTVIAPFLLTLVQRLEPRTARRGDEVPL